MTAMNATASPIARLSCMALVCAKPSTHGDTISQTPNLSPIHEIPTVSHDPLNRTDLEASIDVRAPALERDFELPFWHRELRHIIFGLLANSKTSHCRRTPIIWERRRSTKATASKARLRISSHQRPALGRHRQRRSVSGSGPLARIPASQRRTGVVRRQPV